MEIKLKNKYELITLSRKSDSGGTYYNAILKYVGNNKTEFIVAWNYNIHTGDWGQGRYISLFYDDADDIGKVKQAEIEAKELFAEKYL